MLLDSMCNLQSKITDNNKIKATSSGAMKYTIMHLLLLKMAQWYHKLFE